MKQHSHSDSPSKEPSKKALSPAIIRQDLQKLERDGLGMGLAMGIALIAASVVVVIYRLLADASEADIRKTVLLALLGAILGAVLLVCTVTRYRNAPQKELIIERDTVSYCERDRAGTTHMGGKTRGPVYQDFLHFKSGRELEVERYVYREADDEDFLLVTYENDPETILQIYRLKDYDWQP